ncbi:Pentatricopeptide repeat-containing protein [Quillaja saponaria]|uniref:Pentatricopeptide repeat-containing protein n=1 Tax=Quillaja saponaria TaxID=32244 RepID=A0AAD7VHI2_QUISA|nr:Pentatricopeptide repeat-containing protein [Quillaja saponaria]
MATVIPPNSSTATSPTSFHYFHLCPSFLRNPISHYHRKPPPSPTQTSVASPSQCGTSPSSLSKSKDRHIFHFPASPTQTLESQKSSFYNAEAPFLSESFSERALPDKEDSFFDSLFHMLRLSARFGDTELAKAVHASILKLDEDTYLGNALIAAYVKLGLCSDAYGVFLGLSCPNVVSYTALISGLSKSNREDEALNLFFRMRSSGVAPNEYSLVAILATCSRIIELQLGVQIHAMVIKMGYLDSAFVANTLMGLYGKCGCSDIVLKLFDEIPQRDIASWNTVISSMVNECMYDKALHLFLDLQRNGTFGVDYFTLSTLFAACADSTSVMEGQQIHTHAIKIGLDANLSVRNALIGFYTKCGTVKDVEFLFESTSVKDVITWTAIITAYMNFGLVDLALEIFGKMPEKNPISYNALLTGFCQNGEGSKALDLFVKMVKGYIELTDFSLTSALSACSLLMDSKISEQIHGFILKFGFRSNSCIEVALLDMCTRCGRIADAEKIFFRWPIEEDCSIAWTSMICGYARNGQLDEAISLVHVSQSEGKMVMDEVASTSVLGLCGTIGFHEMGKQIHCHVLKSGFLSDSRVGNAIVSMYFKCWNTEHAIKMFSYIPRTDIVSWNCLIAGHLLHRQGDEALVVWSSMLEMSIKPDKVTFILIISAYKHTYSNLIHDCRSLFLSMRTGFGIEPSSEHYTSFVGVLGYWGLLEEAEETIHKMPFEPEASVWRALLNSCRLHNNTAIGKRVAKQILAMEPRDPSTYILISNLYSASGRWHCSEMVRENMRQMGLHKQPSESWIICQHKIHSFYARDRSHYQAKDVYRGLEILILECLKVGYVPDTSFVLHEVEEHQKKDFLFYHSAKLAATYGLLMTRPGTPIRIVKNILLCGDCHTFLKYVSVVTKREIFLRDSSGFHCFSNGKCSCKDYW